MSSTMMQYLSRVQKAQPTLNDVTVNVPLTGITIGYANALPQLTQLFPVIQSETITGSYFEYPRGDWNRIVAADRPVGTESVGGGFNVKLSRPYLCQGKSVHMDIPDPVRAAMPAQINLEQDAARWVTQQLVLKRDFDLAQAFLRTGVWATESTPSVKWGEVGSTPIQDLMDTISPFKQATTVDVTALGMSRTVWNKLRAHAEFKSWISFGTVQAPSIATPNLLAQILGVPKVVIFDAVYNSAPEGVADNMQYMVGNHVILVHAPDNPGLLTPSAAYTFAWTGQYGATPEGYRLKTMRKEDLEVDRVEGSMNYDLHLVAADLGVFIHDVL